MTASNNYRINLDQAKSGERVSLNGRKIKVVDASSAAALASLRLIYASGSNTRFYDMYLGCEITEAQGFEGFHVHNSAQAGAWIDLDITNGDDDFEYKTPENATIDSIRDAVMTKGGSVRNHTAETVGVVAVQLLAANPDRTGWKVTNNGTKTIYLGSDNTITAADGDPLPAGAVTGFDDTDAVYAISGTAGQDVRITEVEAV